MSDPWRLALAVSINPKAFEDAARDRAYSALMGKPDQVSPWTLREIAEAFAAADRVRVLVEN